MVPAGPVFLFFPTFQIFPCFPSFFPVFYCLSCFLRFFQVKILNCQVFSYTGLLQILENLENLKKSFNFIKVREKSGVFFILKAVCIYFLPFLRMINFFLVNFLAYFLYVYDIEKGCFKASFTFTSFFG